MRIKSGEVLIFPLSLTILSILNLNVPILEIFQILHINIARTQDPGPSIIVEYSNVLELLHCSSDTTDYNFLPAINI